MLSIGEISLLALALCCHSVEHETPDLSAAAEENHVTLGETGTDHQSRLLFSEDAALPSWLETSGGYVYWIDDRDQALRREPGQGGQVDLVAHDVTSGWAGIAADADAVYVAGVDSMLRQLPVDGSAEVAIAELGGERVTQIRVLGSFVYWLTETGQPFSGRPVSSTLHRARTEADTPAETLWDSDVVAVGLALGGGYLFIDEYDDRKAQPNGALLRISAADGSVVSLASGLFFPSVVAADNQFVYFTAQSSDERNTQLWRVSTDGGTRELLYPGGPLQSIDGQMIISDGFIWFAVSGDGDGRLAKVPVGGGEAITVATMTNSPLTRGLAADERRFFFSGSWSWDAIGPGVLWSLAR